MGVKLLTNHVSVRPRRGSPSSKLFFEFHGVPIQVANQYGISALQGKKARIGMAPVWIGEGNRALEVVIYWY